MDGHYTIDTEAYDTQVQCVLLQELEDKELKSVGNWSRTMCDVEIRYDTTRKNNFVAVCVILLLGLYLEGANVTKRTYLHALRWFLDLKKSTRGLGRWRLLLMKFDLKTIDPQGLYHQVVDAISRLFQAGIGSPSQGTDVDDNITRYRIMGQESAVRSTFGDDYSTVQATLRPKELLATQ